MKQCKTWKDELLEALKVVGFIFLGLLGFIATIAAAYVIAQQIGIFLANA